jgi:hypothetical protein
MPLQPIATQWSMKSRPTQADVKEIHGYQAAWPCSSDARCRIEAQLRFLEVVDGRAIWSAMAKARPHWPDDALWCIVAKEAQAVG